MDSTPVSLIRREARAVVTKVIEDNVRGIVQCLPHGDVLELRKLLRTAYPFPERGGWHYKVWCSEVRFALGYQIRKTPRYEKLIKRKPQQVMPAMREWARAQGILDETPESDDGDSEGLAGKVILEMRNVGSAETWVESYDSCDLTWPDDIGKRNPSRIAVTTIAGAKKWAANTVRNYNMDLRPGEEAREVVSVRFIPNATQP